MVVAGRRILLWTAAFSMAATGCKPTEPRAEGSTTPTPAGSDVRPSKRERDGGTEADRGRDGNGRDGDGRNGATERGGRTIAARGTDTTLDIASWNVEWFGDPTHDPFNDELQRQNVHDIIAGTNADIWGLAEIVDIGAWKRLKESLPEYEGFLANEDAVRDHASYYGITEQKVGVLYKRSVAKLLDARVVLPQSNDDFAGRPPLQVRLRVTVQGKTEDLVLMVVHMKATQDESSWGKRSRAAAALKRYLDATWPTERVLVVGDWNDNVTRSITRGKPSPYATFVDDATHYRFLTQTLAARGDRSTAGGNELIDHQLASQALARTELPNSIEVNRVDRMVPNYRRTTSDHFPVISHFTVGR